VRGGEKKGKRIFKERRRKGLLSFGLGVLALTLKFDDYETDSDRTGGESLPGASALVDMRTAAVFGFGIGTVWNTTGDGLEGSSGVMRRSIRPLKRRGAL